MLRLRSLRILPVTNMQPVVHERVSLLRLVPILVGSCNNGDSAGNNCPWIRLDVVRWQVEFKQCMAVIMRLRCRSCRGCGATCLFCGRATSAWQSRGDSVPSIGPYLSSCIGNPCSEKACENSSKPAQSSSSCTGP